MREHLRITFGGRPSLRWRASSTSRWSLTEEGWERPDWPAAQPVLEQRLRRPFPGIALASGNVIAGVLAGRGSGAARRRPAGQASGPLSSHAAWSTRGLRWGAQRRLRYGRQPGRGGGRPGPCWTGWSIRSDVQTRRLTDARICPNSGRCPSTYSCTAWHIPPRAWRSRWSPNSSASFRYKGEPNADSGRLTPGTTERAVARRSSILVWSPAWIGGLWVRPAA